MNIFQPKDLTEALRLLSSGARPMAGCTNLLVNFHKTGEPEGDFADLSPLEELKGIRPEKDAVRVGALCTFAELSSALGAFPHLNALARAAAEMGSPQVRNRATVGGNICDASPACDSGPALLVLNAALTLRSEEGERTLGIDDFFRGVRKTALLPGELLTSLRIPTQGGRSVFRKVGLRGAMAISLVSLAAAEGSDGALRLAMGSVSDRPVRLFACEQALREGRTGDLPAALEQDISPIGDIRATREYRMETAARLLADLLEKEFGYELR